MAGSMKRDVGSGLVMVGSRALLRQNDRSSSNSSIEYSKPTMKVGRLVLHTGQKNFITEKDWL